MAGRQDDAYGVFYTRNFYRGSPGVYFWDGDQPFVQVGGDGRHVRFHGFDGEEGVVELVFFEK